MCLIIFGHGWCWCNRAPWCGNCWTPAVTFRAICSHASLQLPQLPSVQLRLSNRGLRQQSFQPTSRQQRRAGSLKGDAKSIYFNGFAFHLLSYIMYSLLQDVLFQHDRIQSTFSGDSFLELSSEMSLIALCVQNSPLKKNTP